MQGSVVCWVTAGSIRRRQRWSAACHSYVFSSGKTCRTSRFCTVVTPSASAASSRMRFDRLFEPGSFTVPSISFTGAIFSDSVASAVSKEMK